MRHNIRCKQTGRFISRAKVSTPNVVPGRLYGYRGIVVRAGKDTIRHNDPTQQKRHVSFHKSLFGYVPESDLEIIDRSKITTYLQGA